MADAPDWIEQLLGWKPATQKSRRGCEALFGEPIAPNLADVGSRASMHLAGYAYETLDVPKSRIRTQSLDDDSASGSERDSAGAGDRGRS